MRFVSPMLKDNRNEDRPAVVPAESKPGLPVSMPDDGSWI
jgi:hypothetical protein